MLKPKAKARKYGYDQAYLKDNIFKVSVTFNRQNPTDTVLLEWLNAQPGSKVAYIKRLISEDMGGG